MLCPLHSCFPVLMRLCCKARKLLMLCVLSFPCEALAPNIVFVMQPIANPIFCRQDVNAVLLDRMNPQDLTKEVKSLCKKLWDEVNSNPESSANDEVIAYLFKLSNLLQARCSKVYDPQNVHGAEPFANSPSSLNESQARSEDSRARAIAAALPCELLLEMLADKLGTRIAGATCY